MIPPSGSTRNTGSLREQYNRSRRRYVEYFLSLGNGQDDKMLWFIASELANLQLAFSACLLDEPIQVRHFWDKFSEHFYKYSYWRQYLEWGEKTLNIVHGMGLHGEEAWLLSEVGSLTVH
jgi:hypothetical protein